MTEQRIQRLEIIMKWLRELRRDDGSRLNECSCGRPVRNDSKCGHCKPLLIAGDERESKP